jgi:hypothetical protein
MIVLITNSRAIFIAQASQRVAAREDRWAAPAENDGRSLLPRFGPSA